MGTRPGLSPTFYRWAEPSLTVQPLGTGRPLAISPVYRGPDFPRACSSSPDTDGVLQPRKSMTMLDLLAMEPAKAAPIPERNQVRIPERVGQHQVRGSDSEDTAGNRFSQHERPLFLSMMKRQEGNRVVCCSAAPSPFRVAQAASPNVRTASRRRPKSGSGAAHRVRYVSKKGSQQNPIAPVLYNGSGSGSETTTYEDVRW